jgi:N-methylhydantoinase B
MAIRRKVEHLIHNKGGTLWRAMAPHLPDRMTAGHFLSVCGTVVSGPHSDTGELYLLVEPLAGGWGAGRSKDGERGLVCIGDGETYMIPIEVAETRYGIRVDQYAFHSEEGGAGRYRGGNGLVRDYRITSDEAYLTTTFGRHKYLPWGADGGREGTPNYVEILRENGPTERFGKTARFRLKRGEVARLVTGTGGGWGEPTQRPLEEVLDDVRGGYVTIDQAERDYGVAIDPRTMAAQPTAARTS